MSAYTAANREYIRTEQTYEKLTKENKWNPKTVKLAMQFMSLSDEIQVANHTFSLVNFSNHSESMFTDRVKEPRYIGEM